MNIEYELLKPVSNGAGMHAFYGYLLPNGYVERVSRGIYKITEKGEKLLDACMHE